MQIALLQFSASNDESDLELALKRVCLHPEKVSWSAAHTPSAEFSGFIIPNDIALENNTLLSAIQFIQYQNELGKPILGIGTGAEILVKSGVVPGIENNKVGITLEPQKKSDNTESTMRLSDAYQYNAFTRVLTLEDSVPVSVAESKKYFKIPPALLSEMREQGLLVFQYENKNTAAVSNKAGNALAIAPCLEYTTQSDKLFQSMHDYIQSGFIARVAPLFYYPR